MSWTSANRNIHTGLALKHPLSNLARLFWPLTMYVRGLGRVRATTLLETGVCNRLSVGDERNGKAFAVCDL